jgi:hypothetical protein
MNNQLDSLNAQAEIAKLFTGVKLEDNLTLTRQEACGRWTLHLTNLNHAAVDGSCLKIRPDLSFLTMLHAAAGILGCSEADVHSSRTEGCPTCGYGSETHYELEFWN